MLRSILAVGGAVTGPVLEMVGYAALALEVVAAVLIVITVLAATVRYGSHIVNVGRYGAQVERYKRDVAGGMMLALELLVAADILRTIVMEFALETVVVLGLLILIRTFLMWSLIVETEHRWPWEKPPDHPQHGHSESSQTENTR